MQSLLGLENQSNVAGNEMPVDDMLVDESYDDDDYDDDMDALVGSAFESNEFADIGFGVEMASEEEQAMLEILMDGIEDVIHGGQSDRVVQLLKSAGEAFEGIGLAAHAISLSAYMQAQKEGANVSSDLFLGENGVVQETVELLWEVASAINIVEEDNEEQLAASYLNAVRLLGESMLDLDDPTAVQSAQEFVLELELGEEINSEDYLMSEDMMNPQDMMMQDQMLSQDEMRMQGGMPAQAPMEPQPGMEYDFAPNQMEY